MITKDEINNKTKNHSNLKNLHISWIIDKESLSNKHNSFDVFTSINDILYIVYSNIFKSIIFINLFNNQKISEIKNAHNSTISNIKYYLDTINKRDLIISISSDDKNIKLWYFTTLECLLNFNNESNLFSACILNNNNQNYIIPTNNFREPIKIYDFKGTKRKEIDSCDRAYIIESYKNYFLTGNENFVKSYDLNEGKMYQKYFDNDEFNRHLSIIIYDNNKNVKLIESNTGGVVRIWNFHSGKLIKRIIVSNVPLYGICLWNLEFLFAGSYGGQVLLLNLKNGKIDKILDTRSPSKVNKVKKISHPKLGEYLITNNNCLILWK